MKTATRLFSEGILGSSPDTLPFWWRDSLTPGTILIVMAVTVLGAIVSSLPPALASTRRGNRMSRGQGTTQALGTKAKFAIVGQVALCVGLLTMAIGELPDAIMNEVGVSGLEAEDYLIAELRVEGLSLREAATAPGGSLGRYFNVRSELARRLSEEGDVQGVTFASAFPGTVTPWRRFVVEGAAGASAGEPVRVAQVDADFFEVMGVGLVVGRTLDSADMLPEASSRPVAVVNESMARRRLGTTDAVGRRVRLEPFDESSPWLEIIGVVADFGMNAVDPSRPEGLYLPLEPTSYPVRAAIRLRNDPARFVPRLRAITRAVDPTLTLTSIRPLSAIVASARMQLRILHLATMVATIVVVLLSLTGVYGVTSFFVSSRTREIGIRAALGASQPRLVRDVLGRATLQLGWGVVVGAILTVPLMAYGLESGNAGVAVQVSLAILVAGLLSCAAPIRRMLSIEPTEAMRIA